jgi:hypothetical protein
VTQTISFSLGTQTFTFGATQLVGDGSYRYWLPNTQKKREGNSYGKPKIVGGQYGLKNGWEIKLLLKESEWTPFEAAIGRYFKYFDNPTSEAPDWVIFDTYELWTESTASPTRLGTSPTALLNGLIAYYAVFAARLNTDSNWFEVEGRGSTEPTYQVNLSFIETYAFLPSDLGDFLDVNFPKFSQGGSSRISGYGAGSISALDAGISNNGSSNLRGTSSGSVVPQSGNWVIEGYAKLILDDGLIYGKRGNFYSIQTFGEYDTPPAKPPFGRFEGPLYDFKIINGDLQPPSFPGYGPANLTWKSTPTPDASPIGTYTPYTAQKNGLTYQVQNLDGSLVIPTYPNRCNFDLPIKKGTYSEYKTKDVSSQNANNCKATEFTVKTSPSSAEEVFVLYGPYTIRDATSGQLAGIQ